jgi:hypothetical protein
MLIDDLTNGDIVEWLRIEGDVSDLFDVAVIPGVRCPRGLGPADREMTGVARGAGSMHGSPSRLEQVSCV